MSSETALSLYDLNSLVRRSITQCLPDEYWVQAELSDVRTHANGHCYLEFIQKDPRGNAIVAKARGAIWANVFRMLRPYFEESTGQSFVSGLKVLVKVAVEFHELYGYSLTVLDIDPVYTLGDIAQRRNEILKQLKEEGVLTLNKELELPLFTQRVAVISSPIAAGYGDFTHQLNSNVHKYYFYTELFPAMMQGNQVEESVLNALEQILSRQDEFDVVVIIRGGGAVSDLSGFDTYLLAAACAQFPLPIITGIGHERDDTVLDFVAHTRVKTPTAAAEFLIDNLNRVGNALLELRTRLSTSVNGTLSTAAHKLLEIKSTMKQTVSQLLIHKKHRLALIQQCVINASPERILKRGYSLTLKDGKVVTDVSQLKPGDVLTTRVSNGEVKSVVEGKV
ncbi:exodeoxyribonuclease VII large subunit [Bacteroides sp. OttesenSCG-928-J23]|nr:exodeoxyribonuclease VII large subunit [Bacteroides sp. OttesenSCG-928-J23]